MLTREGNRTLSMMWMMALQAGMSPRMMLAEGPPPGTILSALLLLLSTCTPHQNIAPSRMPAALLFQGVTTQGERWRLQVEKEAGGTRATDREGGPVEQGGQDLPIGQAAGLVGGIGNHMVVQHLHRDTPH